MPFYFTPFSIMMFNIHTGYNVRQVPNEEIVLLVSSVYRVEELGIPFIFTDQHAYPVMANYFTDLKDLNQVDWDLLNRRDFKHDPDDPGKKERYGGLEWREVRPEIQRILGDLENVDILVYEPTEKYQNVAKRNGVEELTPARVLIAEMIRRYWVLGIECTYLEVQKLGWFLERTIHSLASKTL